MDELFLQVSKNRGLPIPNAVGGQVHKRQAIKETGQLCMSFS